MGPIPQTALSFSFVLSFAVCRFSRDNPPFPPNLSCAVICLYGGSQAREIAPLEETDLPLASGASVSGRRLCLSFNLKISTASAPAFNCPRFPHPIGSQSVLWKRGALRTFPNEVEEKKKRERKKTHHAVSQTDRSTDFLAFIPTPPLLLRSPISLSSRPSVSGYSTARAPAAVAIVQDLSDLPPSLPPSPLGACAIKS